METDGVIYGRGFRESEDTYDATLINSDDPFVELGLEEPYRALTFDDHQTESYSLVSVPQNNTQTTSLSSSIPACALSESSNFRDSLPLLQSQRISYDENHQLFGDLRQIARHHKWQKKSREEIFYHQAVFMKDFTDQWNEEAEFSRYYPSYEKMNYPQLRSYFSWRTKAREGTIREASLSYIFLYVYELLNNVGVKDPHEGLERLILVWSELRGTLPLLDQYLLPWIKDYYIYYPLFESFHSFVAEHELYAHFPTVYCRTSDSATSFALFSEVASYRIDESVFYNEDTKELVANCFAFVLEHLRSRFSENNLVFEDFIFFTSKNKSKWSPFAKALFYPTAKQGARKVKISDYEEYVCQDGEWLASKIFPCAQGSQLIGYIMKEIEVYLRGIRSYRYRLTANIDSFKAIDQTQFEQLGISLPELVAEGCTAFYKAATWTTVSVDFSNLNHIRTEALETQEKLIVPEENNQPLAFTPSTEYTDTPNETPSAKESDGTIAPSAHPSETSVLASPTSPSTSSESSSIWDIFLCSLNEQEQQVLSLICSGESLKKYALDHALMPEVIIDSINQKALDATGDTIMEIEEEPIIFEEYLSPLLQAL